MLVHGNVLSSTAPAPRMASMRRTCSRAELHPKLGPRQGFAPFGIFGSTPLTLHFWIKFRVSELQDRFLVGDETVKTALLTTLEDLSRRRVVSEAPPLNRSRAALEQILSTRTLPAQQAGQQ